MKVQEYAESASMELMSVEEALSALDRDVDGILEKRRWVLARRAQ
jgi:multiple sugar transport system substrate-binding protein